MTDPERMRRDAIHAISLLFLVLASGCSSIRSTSVATGGGAAPYQGRAQVRALNVPPSATEVGIVETHANVQEAWIEVVEAFAAEAARAGGDIAKLDRVRVQYEMVTQMRHQTYSCGTSQAPRTCSRMVPVTSEVGTLSLTRRAFRSAAQ